MPEQVKKLPDYNDCIITAVCPPSPDSVGLRVSGRHHHQPRFSARPLSDSIHQEVLLPQSADLLHRPGHRDAVLQRRAPAHTGGERERRHRTSARGLVQNV